MSANLQHPLWGQISHLLFNHDCVIVPGFGGFVCNREPARIDQVSHIILPPGKRIVFNQNLKTNDGLLAGSLSARLAISYSEAMTLIDQVVKDLILQLQDKKQLSVESFGSFRLNAEANYVFIPDRENNYLHASYGLMPLQVDPGAKSYGRIRRTRLFRERTPVPRARRKGIRNLGPKAVVLTLSLLLITNGWIYFSNHSMDDLRTNIASMQISSWFDSIFNRPTSHPVEIAEEPPPLIDSAPKAPELVPELTVNNLVDSVSPINETGEPLAAAPSTEVSDSIVGFDLERFGTALAAARPNWYIPHQDNPTVTETTVQPQIITPEQEEEVAEPEPVVAPIASGGKYYIIGGVFCKDHNAEHFRQQLEAKGYHPEILMNPSIHCRRVAYGSYASKQEAEQALRTIQGSENPDAWLFEGGTD